MSEAFPLKNRVAVRVNGVGRPLVDEKSFELAEHFLSGLEGDEASEDQKWELAKPPMT